MISACGRFIAYKSDAGNLVPGDTNGVLDVFVFDRSTGVTERASFGAGGAGGFVVVGAAGVGAAPGVSSPPAPSPASRSSTTHWVSAAGRGKLRKPSPKIRQSTV